MSIKYIVFKPNKGMIFALPPERFEEIEEIKVITLDHEREVDRSFNPKSEDVSNTLLCSSKVM